MPSKVTKGTFLKGELREGGAPSGLIDIRMLASGPAVHAEKLPRVSLGLTNPLLAKQQEARAVQQAETSRPRCAAVSSVFGALGTLG